MNRKQRRADKRSGAAAAIRPFASPMPPEEAASLFRTAMAHHQTGALAAAERAYRQILTAFPTHGEAHSRLGAVLIRQGKTSEAIVHMERAVELRPDLFEAHANLAQIYTWSGQRDQAIDASCRALELFETPQTRAMFAQCVAHARFTTHSDRFSKLLQRALTESWIRPRDLTRACISLVKLNRSVGEGIARAAAAWPARLAPDQLLSSAAMIALADDKLLCCLLETDPIADIGLERLLTNVRYGMLTRPAAVGASEDRLLGFYCSLARQCFINEYVFSICPGEAERAQQLRTSLERALAAGEPCSALWPAVVGAYLPLRSLANAEALLERAWPSAVNELLVQQIEEPAQERRLATTIPSITVIDGEVSRAVRQQYEENPYPRWVRAGAPGQPAIQMHGPPDQGFDALIAGCGTGLSTIEFALQVRKARILAIDLSLASISYAMRMAQKFGITNVEFAQADIMQLAAVGRQFDFIDASGVLHHLADPWVGWRILLSLLRPGGSMQVGLYSELARRDLAAASKLIAERGYRPIAEDIRRCREDIIASEDAALKSTANRGDFFATSECRDLLFHIQEHRVTLPEIKSFLAENDLQFVTFFVDALTQHTFTTRFPGTKALTDLDLWHAFEVDFPNTFAGMYQFSVRKPALSAH